jgi:hypothetical protein
VTITLIFSGCFSARKDTALMREVGIDVSITEYKLKLREFGYRFAGIVVLSADEIISKTSDNEIKKQALLWKIYAIPAMIRSLSMNDPLAAGLDSWILSVQMVQYFEDGYGKDFFGEYQDIAINASRLIVNDIENIARGLKGIDDISKGQKITEDWTKNNPIKNNKFLRLSAIDSVARMIGSEDINLGSTAENIATSIDELKNQVTLYTNYLPKQIKWQIEYAAYEMFGDSTMGSMMQNFNTITQSTDRITKMIEESPELIKEIQISTLEEMDKQRLETLEMISQERIAILEAVTMERIAIMNEINRERSETLDRLDEITEKTFNRSTIFASDTIDKLFWRIIILLGVIFLGCIILLTYYKKIS